VLWFCDDDSLQGRFNGRLAVVPVLRAHPVCAFRAWGKTCSARGVRAGKPAAAHPQGAVFVAAGADDVGLTRLCVCRRGCVVHGVFVF